MTYKFEGVTETHVAQIKKTHPYKVTWVHNNNRRFRHFRTKEAAEAWLEDVSHMVNLVLPVGVTLDIRYTKPFLARKQVGKVRKVKYCGTLTEAEFWLGLRTT